MGDRDIALRSHFSLSVVSRAPTFSFPHCLYFNKFPKFVKLMDLKFVLVLRHVNLHSFVIRLLVF